MHGQQNTKESIFVTLWIWFVPSKETALDMAQVCNIKSVTYHWLSHQRQTEMRIVFSKRGDFIYIYI